MRIAINNTYLFGLGKEWLNNELAGPIAHFFNQLAMKNTKLFTESL
jgi:hypothetical protein